MRAVRAAECIVNVNIAEFCKLFRESRVVLFFLCVVAEVFEKQYFAFFKVSGHFLHFVADTVRGHFDLFLYQFGKFFSRRLQAVLRIRLALRPAEMAHQYCFAAFFHNLFDRRKRFNYSFVIGNIEVLIERDVEVNADEDSFAFQRNVIDCFLIHFFSPLNYAFAIF